MEHHLLSIPENVHWGLWDGTLKPVLTIKSGDRVVIETLSAEPDDVPALGFSIIPGLKEVHERTFRGPGPHFLTGPIFVEDAEPGDVLEKRQALGSRPTRVRRLALLFVAQHSAAIPRRAEPIWLAGFWPIGDGLG